MTTFQVKKVLSSNYYLTNCAVIEDALYCGMYNDHIDTDLFYYKLNNTSLERITLPNTKKHNGSQVFNLNNKLYVVTLGLTTKNDNNDDSGSLVFINGKKATGFPSAYSMHAFHILHDYFDRYIVYWYDVLGSKKKGQGFFYECDEDKSYALSISNISSFFPICSTQYKEETYLAGNVGGTISGKAAIYKITSLGEVKEVSGCEQDPSICGITVFNDKLYAVSNGMRDTSIKLYEFDGQKFSVIWTYSGKDDYQISGEIVSFKDYLLIPIIGTDTGRIYGFGKDGKVAKLIDEDAFKKLEPYPYAYPDISPLLNRCCMIVYKDEKVYLITGSSSNNNYYRSNLYEITTGSTTSPVDVQRPETVIETSSTPVAGILANEFYNLQDLDGNDKIYGYDFKIADDTKNKPPNKPILLVLLERNKYWKDPETIITWKDFLSKNKKV